MRSRIETLIARIITAAGIALAAGLYIVAALLPPVPTWLAVIIVGCSAIFAVGHGWFAVIAIFDLADPPRSPLEQGRQPLTPADGTMRGGWLIGVLERAATAVAIGVGQFATLAVIVAVKAVGRFGELDKPESRERFIIGSMASLAVGVLWGGVAHLFSWGGH